MNHCRKVTKFLYTSLSKNVPTKNYLFFAFQIYVQDMVELSDADRNKNNSNQVSTSSTRKFLKSHISNLHGSHQTHEEHSEDESGK